MNVGDFEKCVAVAMDLNTVTAERDRLREEVAWLRAQVERLTQPAPPSGEARFDFDTVCVHEWMTDTAGTRCSKCGLRSNDYGAPWWVPPGTEKPKP